VKDDLRLSLDDDRVKPYLDLIRRAVLSECAELVAFLAQSQHPALVAAGMIQAARLQHLVETNDQWLPDLLEDDEILAIVKKATRKYAKAHRD
jgi:hypothetical protein